MKNSILLYDAITMITPIGGGGGGVGRVCSLSIHYSNGCKYGRQNVNKFLHTYTPVLINMYQVKIPYYNRGQSIFILQKFLLLAKLTDFTFPSRMGKVVIPMKFTEILLLCSLFFIVKYFLGMLQ